MLRPPCLAPILVVLAACGGEADFVPPPPPSASDLAALVDDETRADIEAATRAVEARPAAPQAWDALGKAYEVADMNDRAETCYLAAAGLAPDEPRHPYRAAVCAGRQGEPERALEHLDRALGLADGYGPGWRRRGTWLLELGRTDGAREAFLEAARLMAGKPDALVGLANTALLDDDVDAALGYAKKAHELVPSDPYVRLVLGEALRRAGRTGEAAPHLAAGEGAVPTYADPWSESVARERNRDSDQMARARSLEQAGEYDAALAIYRDVARRRPDDTNVLLRHGIALVGAGKVPEAVRHFEDATRRFPGDFDLLVAQLTALRRAGAAEDAERRCAAIAERWPDRPEVHLARGSLLQDRGDTNGARAAFREAAAVAPEDLRAPMAEGQLLLRGGNAAAAARVLEARALDTAVRPSMEYFKLTLQAMLLARESTASVGRVYDRAVEVHGDEARRQLTREGAREPR